MRSFTAIGIAAAAVMSGGPAHAYEIAHTDGGEMVRWHSAPQFETSPKSVAALRAAAREWNQTLPAGLAIEIAPASEAQIDARDYINSVVWMDEDFGDEFDELALAATVRAYRRSSGVLVDADIAINGSGYDWSIGDMAGCDLAFDLQAVLTHELGHAIGLNHNEAEPATVMYPAIPPCQPKRTLDDDDKAGATLLYAGAELSTDGDTPAPGSYGCSAAGGSGSAAGLGLMLLALALCGARRRGAAIAACVLSLSGLGAGSADAAVVRGVELEQLATRSALVLRGHVVGEVTTTARGRVYSDTAIAVDACWRGDCPSTLIVRQLGGAVGDVAVEVEGTAALSYGDEVVLFLRPRRDGAWSPTGMALGAFAVRRANNSVKAVRDARGLVLAQPSGAVVRGRVDEIDLEALERRVEAAK